MTTANFTADSFHFVYSMTFRPMEGSVREYYSMLTETLDQFDIFLQSNETAKENFINFAMIERQELDNWAKGTADFTRLSRAKDEFIKFLSEQAPAELKVRLFIN